MYKIGIIGLGYVGLPLALEFGKKYNTVGFDKSIKRIRELKKNVDITRETSKKEIGSSKKISFSNKIEDLKNCNVYIIAVPTPINKKKEPNLKPLYAASKTVGKLISINDIVIYESTVYPGLTEEYCVPILEKYSGLDYISERNKKNGKKGFYCGYSPERVNPGDKSSKVSNIVKVTSGSTREIARKIDRLYSSIISAGTHMTQSIKIAEAAKVIENTQRDLNIALINELSIIFNKMSIDTQQVLKAAETKWNFLPFKPGLVGGHCIGVDPYYLTYKSKQIGYTPEVILSGRKINDQMPKYVVKKVFNIMKKKKIEGKNLKFLICGAAFKEDCSDTRNSKSIEIMEILKKKYSRIDCYDPIVAKPTLFDKQGIQLKRIPNLNFYDVIIIAVAHNQFIRLGINKIKKFAKKKSVIFDVKSVFKESEVDGRL